MFAPVLLEVPGQMTRCRCGFGAYACTFRNTSVKYGASVGEKYESDKNISASETKAATVCKRCTHVSEHLPDESINRPVNFRPKASEQLFSATAARHLLSSRPLNLVIPNRFLLNYERAAHTHKHTGWPKKSKPLSLIIIKSY